MSRGTRCGAWTSAATRYTVPDAENMTISSTAPFMQQRSHGKLCAMSQPPRIDGCREADALAIELARANTHLHFFKRLHENYRELGGAKDFWDFTLAAHIGMALLQLARVYDTRREGLNMQRVLRAVDEKLLDKADRQSLMDHTCQCAKQDRLVGKLKEWRDNVIAHYNCDCALAPRDNFWNMYSWELCEVHELI